MKRYSETIGEARVVRDIQSCVTTGDLEYSGTALEISDDAGAELFHIVVDSSGERHILFFPSSAGYRIPVDVMERVLAKAKDLVNVVGDSEI